MVNDMRYEFGQPYPIDLIIKSHENSGNFSIASFLKMAKDIRVLQSAPSWKTIYIISNTLNMEMFISEHKGKLRFSRHPVPNDLWSGKTAFIKIGPDEVIQIFPELIYMINEIE